MTNLRLKTLLLYFVAGLVLALAFAVYMYHLGAIFLTPSTDEGLFLSAARLLHLGYPSESIFFDEPLFFPYLINLAFGVGGDSIFVGRFLIVTFAMIALAALTRFARLFSAPFAIPFVLAFTALMPFFVQYSREVLGEVPMIAFLLLSLLALVEYVSQRRAVRLIGSAVFFALALAVKPLGMGFGISILVVLWFGAGRTAAVRPTVRRRIGELVSFGLICGLVLIPTMQLYRVSWFVDEVMAIHVRENGIYLPQPEARLQFLGGMAQANLALIVLAIPGLVAAARRNFILTVALCGALIATLGVILTLPPFDHHFLVLVPFLALFAGIGVWQAIEWLLPFVSHNTRADAPTLLRPRGALLYLAVFAMCLLVALTQVPGLALQDKDFLRRTNTAFAGQVRFVKSQIAAGTFVMGDSPPLLYLSGAVVPSCAVMLTLWPDFKIIPNSLERLDTCFAQQPVQAVLVSGGFTQVPGLMESLQRRFPTIIEGAGMKIYK